MVRAKHSLLQVVTSPRTLSIRKSVLSAQRYSLTFSDRKKCYFFLNFRWIFSFHVKFFITWNGSSKNRSIRYLNELHPPVFIFIICVHCHVCIKTTEKLASFGIFRFLINVWDHKSWGKNWNKMKIEQNWQFSRMFRELWNIYTQLITQQVGRKLVEMRSFKVNQTNISSFLSSDQNRLLFFFFFKYI